MKFAANLLLFCLCGPLLCLATETTSTGTTTTAKTLSSSSSSGTVTPHHENDTSPKILPADTPSPVTFIKQEPVIEHKADLNDFIKQVLNVGDAPSSAEVSSSSQTVASDEAVEDEVHQNVRIQELLKGILADEFGSEEDEEDLEDFDSDEPDVFHEDAGNSSDDADDDDNEEESFTTTEAPDGTVTTTSNDVEDEANEDGKTTVAETGVTPSERASRAEESSTKGKSSRKVNKRRNGGGKKQKNGKKDNMARYNRYVDLVFKRMNTLIRSKRMDPLRVNLYAGSNNNNNSKNNNSNKNKNNGNNGNSNPKRSGSPGKAQGPKRGRPGSKYSKKNKNNNDVVGQRRGHQKHRTGGYRPPRFEVDHPYVFEEIHRQDRQDDISEETSMDNKTRPSSLESLSNRTTTSTTHAPDEETSTGSESKEMKPHNGNGNRPTRGILRGLSTLKRQGQVKVIRRSASVSVLRSAFSLGPVALDILQKSANSSKPETAATATAQKLKGVLEIRLKNSGPTRIRRLRVFPPKNVRVKGEKTGLKKQGYRKITPVAAKRLMSVANQVVRQSDQSRGRPGKNNNKNKNKLRPGQKRPAAPGQATATKPQKRTNNNRGKGPNRTRNNNNGGARRKIPRDDRHEQ